MLFFVFLLLLFYFFLSQNVDYALLAALLEYAFFLHFVVILINMHFVLLVLFLFSPLQWRQILIIYSPYLLDVFCVHSLPYCEVIVPMRLQCYSLSYSLRYSLSYSPSYSPRYSLSYSLSYSPSYSPRYSLSYLAHEPHHLDLRDLDPQQPLFVIVLMSYLNDIYLQIHHLHDLEDNDTVF